jgi:hypothetical protein
MKKAVLAALLLCSCLDNSLGGSVSEVFPLGISGTELRGNDQAIQVTYFNNRGVFVDVVARISVSLEIDGVAEDGGVNYLVPKAGTTIVVAGDYADGHPRCVVTHAPGGEPEPCSSRCRRTPSMPGARKQSYSTPMAATCGATASGALTSGRSGRLRLVTPQAPGTARVHGTQGSVVGEGDGAGAVDEVVLLVG